MHIYDLENLVVEKWCPGADSNHRHEDFQSSALVQIYVGISKTKQKLYYHRHTSVTRRM